MLYFTDPPSVHLLQSLARNSLKQNLLRAIRLWVWLRFLYPDPDQWSYPDRQTLPTVFSFSDWRNSFFTPSHPNGEGIPLLHDDRCCCAFTAANWLFDGAAEITPIAWCRSLEEQDAAPEQLDEILQTRLFGVTRRTLNEDLRILFKLGWVEKVGEKYTRVKEFPHRPQPKTDRASVAILQPDLAAIADNLSQVLDGHQRFFLHVEYIVPTAAADRVDDWQAQLRQIWEQSPTRPVRIVYHSANGKDYPLVVYPVCCYYVQRAAYLCAWGQFPDGQEGRLDWRNYRLDRIHAMVPLTWEDRSIPAGILAASQQRKLPTPNHIQERMSEAWGFDFYRPAHLLLLRFDQTFADGYIRNSIRHETFEAVSYDQARRLILQTTEAAERKQLLRVLEQRSPDDGYYIAYGRSEDINLMLRLRAWRPKMEVLLPWKLRQQVATEVALEQRLYSEG
jgi:CRISPR-associated protein (TIGR03985 family)